MAEKKKIPCRVCKNLFEPCTYCQSHADVFRWRNFACSRECATKYINDTIAYRDSLKSNGKRKDSEKVEAQTFINIDSLTKKPAKEKRKSNKKISENIAEDKTENIETD